MSDLMELLHGSGVEDIMMPRADFIKEHKRLIGVLRRGKPAELKSEAAEQAAELQQQLKGGRGPSAWIMALKEWNAKSPGSWCVPRKGSAPYDEVREIFARLKGVEPSKELKSRKGRKTKAAKEAEEKAAKEAAEREAEERLAQRAEEVAARRGEEAKARRKEEGLKKVREYAQGVRERTPYCSDEMILSMIEDLRPSSYDIFQMEVFNSRYNSYIRGIRPQGPMSAMSAAIRYSKDIDNEDIELLKKCRPLLYKKILADRKKMRVFRSDWEAENASRARLRKNKLPQVPIDVLFDEDRRDIEEEEKTPISRRRELINKHRLESGERQLKYAKEFKAKQPSEDEAARESERRRLKAVEESKKEVIQKYSSIFEKLKNMTEHEWNELPSKEKSALLYEIYKARGTWAGHKSFGESFGWSYVKEIKPDLLDKVATYNYPSYIKDVYNTRTVSSHDRDIMRLP